MSEDDIRERLARLEERLEAFTSWTEKRFADVPDTAAAAGKAAASSLIDGYMMSNGNQAEQIGRLLERLDGPHGLEQRLLKMDSTVHGVHGDNGLRSVVKQMRFRTVLVLGVLSTAVSALLYSVYGARFFVP